MSSTPATSMKCSSSIRSVEVVSNKINIRPFTSKENCWNSPTNVNSSAGNSMRQDKEEEGMGFMMMSFGKPQSLRPYSRSPHRMKWSREVENAPSSNALNKNNIKALVGSNLAYTDTSHWWSSSFNKVDGQFKLSGSCGIMVTQDLRQGNMAKICTSILEKKTGGNPDEELSQGQLSLFDKEVVSESVPLSFEDELERKNVKVLTPCPTTIYKALPIVSETYPVVYRPQQHQYEPFSSPGFHRLDPPEPLTQDTAVRKSNVYSAIIHNTESIQADYMLHSLRERQAAEGLQCSRSYPESGLEVKRTGAYCMNLSMLSADGNVVKSPDLGRHHLHYHSVPTKKDPLIPLAVPRKKGLSFSRVGPVKNGRNPGQTCDPGEISSAYFKQRHGTPSRNLSSRCSNSAPQTHQSKASCPKLDFIVISKPVKYSQNSVKRNTTKLKTYIEAQPKGATKLSENFLQVAGGEMVETHGMSFSTPTNIVGHMFHNTTTPVNGTDTEDHSKLNYSLHHPQPINIPTAESVN